MLRSTLILLLAIVSIPLLAQERIQPGKMYKGGDQIYAPLTGTVLTIPDHWRGYGTLETEMLTLSSDTSNATLRIFSVQDNLVSIKNRLPMGVELAPGVEIKPKGDITFGDNILSSELYMTNDPKISGYFFVKCGEFGNCVGFLFGTQTKTHELYLDGLNEMMHEVSLQEPSIVEPGADFDWAKELGEKHLFHYESNNSGIMGNQLWLCSDGSFTAKLKRKGMFNDKSQKKIKGNHSGTYRLEGVGTTGTIILYFPKFKEERSFPTEFKEGEIYINGVKYFKAVHTKCQ